MFAPHGRGRESFFIVKVAEIWLPIPDNQRGIFRGTSPSALQRGTPSGYVGFQSHQP